MITFLLCAALQDIERSENVTVASFGNVKVVTVGKGKVDEKPAVLVVGVNRPGDGIALRLISRLAKSDLLDRFTFYVIPRPSPDAFAAKRAGNLRKTDDDRDGTVGEDPGDDLNGDGTITVMRVEDESGGWMPHPDDARILIQADPKKNEKGRWAVYVEGRDDDGDGAFNEDGSGGVDFNRNFTFQYPYFQKGAGPHQVSEPETRAVADFAFAHPNIAAVLTFTDEDNLYHVWQPNGDSDRSQIPWAIHSDDAPFAHFVAERFREIHGGKDVPGSPDGEGSFSEWAYFHFGRWSFASRGWWIPKAEGEIKEPRGADQVNALRARPESFVEWTEVKHPDFPNRKVEVGGFKPVEAPAADLDASADKHLEFLKKLGELMPRIAMRDLKVEDLGEGVVRVTATVVNQGYLPTFPAQGDRTAQIFPLQIAIDLPAGATLATGAARRQVERLAGNGGKAERSWLVVGAKGKITVRAWAPAVGSDSKSAEVK